MNNKLSSPYNELDISRIKRSSNTSPKFSRGIPIAQSVKFFTKLAGADFYEFSLPQSVCRLSNIHGRSRVSNVEHFRHDRHGLILRDGDYPANQVYLHEIPCRLANETPRWKRLDATHPRLRNGFASTEFRIGKRYLLYDRAAFMTILERNYRNTCFQPSSWI